MEVDDRNWLAVGSLGAVRLYGLSNSTGCPTLRTWLQQATCAVVVAVQVAVEMSDILLCERARLLVVVPVGPLCVAQGGLYLNITGCAWCCEPFAFLISTL